MTSASPPSPSISLHRGQELEREGQFAAALAAYDEAIQLLSQAGSPEPDVIRQRGVAWMNRGNVLQKLGDEAGEDAGKSRLLAASVEAYDEALACFRTLSPAVPLHRHHAGAAWVNRGHALLSARDADGAAAAFEAAIAILSELPPDGHPAYVLNLAGAWTNLAHTIGATQPSRAEAAARAALALVADRVRADLPFAEMSLRTRRAFVMAIGHRLAGETSADAVRTGAAEASDLIDDGLALAREWEERGESFLRPLAFRLFRLGSQLYRRNQPHFLAEFVLENVDPAVPGTYADDPGFRAAASAVLAEALADLEQPQMLIAGTPTALRVTATARSLRDAAQRLTVTSTS